jgi:RecA/RadA recombinase
MDTKAIREQLMKESNGHLFSFSDAADRYMKGAISTGSIVLDYMTAGGPRKGYPTCIWGDPGTMKTTACLLMAAQALKADPTKAILYVDTEIRLNPEYQSKTTSGIDIHPLADRSTFDDKKGKWIITDDEGNIMEMTTEEYDAAAIPEQQAIQTTLGENIDVYTGGSSEDLLDFLLHKICPSGAYQMIIIDSQDKLIPSRVLEKDENAFQQGSRAQFLNAWAARLHPLVWENDIALIYTSQMRQAMVMYGSPDTMGGGRGFRHSLSLIVKFSAPKVEIKPFRGKDKLGQTITIRIDDSRVCNETALGAKAGFKPGSFSTARMVFGHGWDNDEALGRLGDHFGFITGRFKYIADDGTEIKGRSKQELIDNLRTSGKMMELWNKVVGKAIEI